MRVAAFVPARAGSTRLPNKNLAVINRRSLLQRAIESAACCEEKWVSTDSKECAAVAREHGALVHVRPPELATATADVTSAIAHWYDGLTEKPDAIVLLNPTSPFRTASMVAEAVKLLESSRASSVVSVTLGYEPHFGGTLLGGMWRTMRESGPRVRTQDLPGMGHENGAIFAFTREFWEVTGRITGGACMGYPMSKWDSIDIDTQADLDAARRLAGTDR